MDSLKTDNELIAEFMGMTIHVPENKGYASYYREFDSKGFIKAEHYKRGNEYKTLAYDKSWDWLMPVVDKIHGYTLVHPDQVKNVCDLKVVVLHSVLYQRVVDFVKYLNAQPK